MGVLGIGTDILYLPRIASLVKRRSAERLAGRILSNQEHEQWRSIYSTTERLKFLGVRWSVKEAAYKALQPDITLRWKEASFIKDTTSTSRKPILQMASGLVPAVRFHASVSHDGDNIIATVLAETEGHGQGAQKPS